MLKRLDDLFDAFAESELCGQICLVTLGLVCGFVIGLALRWPQ